MDNLKIGVSLVNYHNDVETIAIAKKYLNIPIVSKVVIVNNDCEETDASLMRSIDDNRVKIFNEEKNLGYSKGNNIALKYLIEDQKCDYVIISNSDVDFEDEVIQKLVKKFEDDRNYAALAPKMVQSDGTILPLRYIDMGAKRIVLRVVIPGLDAKYEKYLKAENGIYNQSFLPGSFFMVNGLAMRRCGYFDPNVFLYREEEILGQRLMRKGDKLGVVDGLIYIHNHRYSKQTFRQVLAMQKYSMKSERYFFRKYLKYKGLMMIHVYIWQLLFICRELCKAAIKKTLNR